MAITLAMDDQYGFSGDHWQVEGFDIQYREAMLKGFICQWKSFADRAAGVVESMRTYHVFVPLTPALKALIRTKTVQEVHDYLEAQAKAGLLSGGVDTTDDES